MPKTPSSPLVEKEPTLAGGQPTPDVKTAAEIPAASSKAPKPEVPEKQKKEEEEDDWLTGALSRKKASPASFSEGRRTKQEDSLSLGENVDLDSFLRYGRDTTSEVSENELHNSRVSV